MLNPWGDLIAMARSWCLVKPGGYGLVGVPTGPDTIAFNSHKIYGRHGLAQIFANWEQVSSTCPYQLLNYVVPRDIRVIKRLGTHFTDIHTH